MDFGLKDRVAVVLAASKGLGRAAAESLAREGCRLAICARNQEAIERAGREIGAASGQEVLALRCDVSNAGELDAFFQAALARYGHVDVLVNNAGGPRAGEFETFSDADWLEACQLTLMHVVRACRHVIPGMKERKWGRILNVTSVSVKQPIPGMVLSNTLRPAVAGLSKSLALELAPFGILLHCLLPGSFLTDRNIDLGTAAAAQRGITLDDLIQEWQKGNPMGRMAEPSEFGDLVAFLASERCSFATGTCFVIDGGNVKSLY